MCLQDFNENKHQDYLFGDVPEQFQLPPGIELVLGAFSLLHEASVLNTSVIQPLSLSLRVSAPSLSCISLFLLLTLSLYDIVFFRLFQIHRR